MTETKKPLSATAAAIAEIRRLRDNIPLKDRRDAHREYLNSRKGRVIKPAKA